ncbi:MAG: nodulation protein NfeD [Thermodesulfobacteriota bacterium]|nr:MAG: nodulation protein NfeD [Thermodesulfobacteriota bacterium]
MRLTKKIFSVFVLLPAVFLFLLLSPAPSEGAQGEIHYVYADGIINPVMAEFLTGSIKEAAEAKASAVIIEMDTPGGLDLSMREIVKAELASVVPVIVYVAPPGSRAASAGVFIAYAANIAAMAPGTNIGSAHPVALGGGKADETMMKKVENDAVAYIKSIAKKRGRNAGWAEKAVRESVNITAGEALKLKVINIVAADRAELIKKLDGRKVEVLSGPMVLHTSGAGIKDVRMNFRHRILNAITNPNVAYILMMVGLLGLYFELSSPGAILPGVIGVISLILAFYAFQTLSINYAGLLLIGVAVVLFIVEMSVVSYGLLTIAGIISLILGSLMLFKSPLPFMQLSLWVILPTVIFVAGFILFTMYYVVALYRRAPVTGAEALIGEEGEALDEVAPGKRGKVYVDGEYWDAVSDELIKKGDHVRVVKLKGLLLRVVKV